MQLRVSPYSSFTCAPFVGSFITSGWFHTNRRSVMSTSRSSRTV